MAKLITHLLMLLCLFMAASVPVRAEEEKPERWVVYYGSDLPSDRFLPYHVIVFDTEKSPPLRPLMNRGKELLGYLSIGEAESFRHDFKQIKEMGALLEENPDWPNHYIVDIRNKQWVKYLIEVKIPEILHKKFDGLMLDTLDSPLYLWEKDKQKYAGMDEAAIDLIATIRKHYPKVKVMLNRGFHVLPEVAPFIDMSLAESIVVNYQGESKEPTFFPSEVTESYVKIIDQAKQINPALKIYSLEYWPVSDVEKIKAIYAQQRERGYIPYVTSIDLMQEFAEPK